MPQHSDEKTRCLVYLAIGFRCITNTHHGNLLIYSYMILKIGIH